LNETPLRSWLVLGAFCFDYAQLVGLAIASGALGKELLRRIARLRRVSKAQADRAGDWGFVAGVAVAFLTAALFTHGVRRQ
jgi:hypothetical protein